MYQADGIDLTKTQYEELCYVSRLTRPDDPSLSRAPVYAYVELYDMGLVDSHITGDGDRVVDAKLTAKGANWLASYEKSERDRKWLLRRDWRVMSIGAVSGGVVSLVVTLILHFVFGL